MKTTGNRKMILGLAYLAVCSALGWKYLCGPATDLLGLGAVFTGIATGVLSVVWGNTKEHEHAAKNGGSTS